MDFIEKIDSILREIAAGKQAPMPQVRRICAEIDFAKRFIDVKPEMEAV